MSKCNYEEKEVNMTFNKLFSNRSDAIQILILDPLESSSAVEDAQDEYDIDSIADEVLKYNKGTNLFELTVDSDDFWVVVESHAISD